MITSWPLLMLLMYNKMKDEIFEKRRWPTGIRNFLKYGFTHKNIITSSYIAQGKLNSLLVSLNSKPSNHFHIKLQLHNIKALVWIREKIQPYLLWYLMIMESVRYGQWLFEQHFFLPEKEINIWFKFFVKWMLLLLRDNVGNWSRSLKIYNFNIKYTFRIMWHEVWTAPYNNVIFYSAKLECNELSFFWERWDENVK